MTGLTRTGMTEQGFDKGSAEVLKVGVPQYIPIYSTIPCFGYNPSLGVYAYYADSLIITARFV